MSVALLEGRSESNEAKLMASRMLCVVPWPDDGSNYIIRIVSETLAKSMAKRA